MNAISPFPDDFLWGASTAAYQIEGAAEADGRGPSIWDTFSATPGRTFEGHTGAVACDHYHRWREDFQIAADLGLKAYRMSVSWARLQPRGRGDLNPAAVAFYREQLADLRAKGIRSAVTLYHWDLPQVLEDEGGWPERATAEAFADYAARTAAALGDLVDEWIPINEAWCAAFLGYHVGVHAPGRQDRTAALRAAHHLNVGHGLAVAAIRNAVPGAKVGSAVIMTDVEPASDSATDREAARLADGGGNRLFLDPLFKGSYPEDMLRHFAPTGAFDAVRPGDMETIAAPLDFVGVNHYHRFVIEADPSDEHLKGRALPPSGPVTSFDWEIRPDSLRRVLERLSADYTDLPVYITESGASFDDAVGADGTVDDADRVDYLDGYMKAAGRAIEKGVNLRGYFVWSLLDNFEWAEGYAKRFGLVRVDYETQRRTLKRSAEWYRDVIATGGESLSWN
ncbi:GH1 family beta-glucosidase [Glycomyces sp. NRRL B-16210]|uniref:GH1 family beta-glucosidase n=1 Tax=Glycomyces sp. NRRL B-16210 TaxID=1463821 RepID=UPI0004C06C57|nr:GH1 family beta-glucosidase [Glycomyces sp. NRRL B-16210]